MKSLVSMFSPSAHNANPVIARIWRCCLGPALFLFAFNAVAPANSSELDWDQEARLLMHVAYLASDSREGRGIGTAGLDSAASYIENRFSESRLEPLFEKTFRQRLHISWGVNSLPGTAVFSDEDTLRLGTDIQPLGFTSDGEARAPAIFVGYGVTAPEYDYDDYGEIEAEGKIVVMLEGEPASENPDSRFAGAYDTEHAVLRTKAINARTHGAVGMIVVRNPLASESGDSLPAPRTDEPYREAGIPAIYVTHNALKNLFPDFRLLDAQRSIDVNESPRSMPIGKDSVALRAEVRREKVAISNVGAALPGDERVLVVGAHYDHLGYGQSGSTEPGVHAVHNGADDNASGVAIMLETARILALNPPGPTIWFIAFSGEEIGLAGSSWFTNHPPNPLDSVEFMLNLDMLGRMRDNKLIGLGVHSAEGLEKTARRAASGLDIELTLTGNGYGPSDQTSFYANGIPVLHLLTAAHEDYHSPRDDVSKINGAGMVKALDYALRLVKEISRPNTELKYVEKAAHPALSGTGAPRPYLGTIPDFAQPDSLRGVRIQGVRSGSPADKAELHGGDVLVEMDGIIIDNLYDFVFALRKHKPGDKVTIYFMRNGSRLSTRAKLAKSAGKSGHGG